MGKFFRFDSMITPIFIKVFSWLGIIAVIIAGFFMVGYGFIASDAGFMQIISGVIILFIGPLIIRIYCEMLIVIFKMQESLIQIRDHLYEQRSLIHDNDESA